MSAFRPLKSSLASVLALSGCLLLGACDALDQLLEVEAPSRVIARDLDRPTAAGLLVESVGNEFRCAFTHYVNVSGLVGWELRSTVLGGATQSFYDQRVWTTGGYGASSYAGSDCESGSAALYIPLARTRWFADEVLDRLDEWGEEAVPEKTALEAETAAWAGYTYLLLGESMCEVAFDEGPEQSPDASFQLAVDRFDRAISAAESADREDFLNVARVGKGRALLNLGRLSDAAAAVAEVPEGFDFLLEYSSLSDATHNRQYRSNHRDENVSVGTRYLDMSFDGEDDPRVPVTDQDRDVAGYGVPLWTTDKYESLDDPVRLAGWEEAQLILAEAAVADGRLEDAVDIINVLHDNVDLPHFESTDAAEIMDQIVYERRAELFLEGQHLMDIRRYDLGLYPAPGEPYPDGGVYGDQTCFPLPDVETLNNPSIGSG